MSSHRWRQVNDRFHVLGYLADDQGELIETAEVRIEAEVVGAQYLEDYPAGVTIFDTMAHRGKWQLWKVTEAGLEELERRPAK